MKPSNKKEFLDALAEALKGIPESELHKTLDYYAEFIDDAVEDGAPEGEVIAGLGDIHTIADKIIEEIPLSKLVKENMRHKHDAVSVPMIILAIIGSPIWLPLFLAGIAVVLSLYLSLWTFVVALFCVFAALTASAGALLVASVPLLTVSIPQALLTFGTALVCGGLAVFLFFLSVFAAKLVIRLAVWLIKAIKNAFIRKGGENA